MSEEKESAIPVFKILENGEMVGMMFDEETANKVADYLNQGKEFISAFAFSTGKLIEQMIETRSASNAARVAELEAMILSFRPICQNLDDTCDESRDARMLDAFDKHFGIKTDKEGNNG